MQVRGDAQYGESDRFRQFRPDSHQPRAIGDINATGTARLRNPQPAIMMAVDVEFVGIRRKQKGRALGRNSRNRSHAAHRCRTQPLPCTRNRQTLDDITFDQQLPQIALGMHQCCGEERVDARIFLIGFEAQIGFGRVHRVGGERDLIGRYHGCSLGSGGDEETGGNPPDHARRGGANNRRCRALGRSSNWIGKVFCHDDVALAELQRIGGAGKGQ